MEAFSILPQEAAKELVSEFAAGLIMLKEKDNQEMILNFQSNPVATNFLNPNC
jgi:hypothetical protein